MENTYIALLRGINVSGQKKIKMADLRLHIETLGLSQVQTYIQSGNIVFRSALGNSKDLAEKIFKKIEAIYGFEVPVVVKTKEQLQAAVSNNPFTKTRHQGKLYIAFLHEAPSMKGIQKIEAVDYSPEEYHIDGENIYLYPPNGYGRAKLTNNIFESKLKVSATTRNWKTISKLIEMAEEN